jgi:cyclophilin family peptidyl-prolyl cis-trans isomerase
MSKLATLAIYAMALVATVGEAFGNDKETTMAQQHPIVQLKTSAGDIKIELYEDKAPETVRNFLSYVETGHYDHTIFHRVIDNFMIQGGGFTRDMDQKPVKAPIRNEADNGLKNRNGSIAMARTSDVNSATAQFFINVQDNSFLDFKSASPSGYGYCVFGQVVDGLDVIAAIKKVKTGNRNGHSDVPVEPVEIVAATVVTAPVK